MVRATETGRGEFADSYDFEHHVQGGNVPARKTKNKALEEGEEAEKSFLNGPCIYFVEWKERRIRIVDD